MGDTPVRYTAERPGYGLSLNSWIALVSLEGE